MTAAGRAAHSGSAPDQGRNALLGLAGTALAPATTTPPGPERLSVVPTVMRSGDAFNVVPAAGRVVVRHARRPAGGVRRRCSGRFRPSSTASTLEASMERRWPGMDAIETHPPRCSSAPRRGWAARSSVARAAAPATPATSPPTVPMTIDGLGPRGGGGTHPAGVRARAGDARSGREVALAVAARSARYE